MTSHGERYMGSGDLVPRPDPTALTTAAVERALAAYREIVDVRLDGMDKAVQLLADGALTAREEVARIIAHERADAESRNGSLREVMEGNLNNLSTAVNALDRRVSEQFNNAQVALAAALAAQKDAVAAALAAAEKAVSAALTAQKDAIAAALTAADKAVDARQTSAEREFHEHLEQYRHEVDFAFAASDRAITKAEVATEKRFEGVNEFRQQLGDQASTFMSRAEATSLYDRTSERIQDLTNRINRTEGRGVGLSAGWVYLLGALAAVGTLVSLYVAFKGG